MEVENKAYHTSGLAHSRALCAESPSLTIVHSLSIAVVSILLTTTTGSAIQVLRMSLYALRCAEYLPGVRHTAGLDDRPRHCDLAAGSSLRGSSPREVCVAILQKSKQPDKLGGFLAQLTDRHGMLLQRLFGTFTKLRALLGIHAKTLTTILFCTGHHGSFVPSPNTNHNTLTLLHWPRCIGFS